MTCPDCGRPIKSPGAKRCLLCANASRGPQWEPTPEEIAAECAKIRAEKGEVSEK